MPNTTRATLRTNALRKAGNRYNASDTTLLTIADDILNDVFGMIQSLIKGHPFTLDIGNTISTVADQAYVEPVDTDIIEILQVYQRVNDRKMRQITYTEYINMVPDPTRISGNPDVAWAPTMTVDVTGNNDWRIYLVPTPSSVLTLYYDYLKDIRLTTDAAFCALPPTYDGWIYAEFKPLFYEILESNNRSRIADARLAAKEARSFYLQSIMSQADRIQQVDSYRGSRDGHFDNLYRVAKTT